MPRLREPWALGPCRTKLGADRTIELEAIELDLARRSDAERVRRAGGAALGGQNGSAIVDEATESTSGSGEAIEDVQLYRFETNGR